MSIPSLPKSFRLKEVPEQQKQLPNFPKSFKSKQQNQSFDDENDLDREIERNQAQITSRMLERLFGAFGNAYQMTPEILKKIQPLNPILNKIPTEQKLRKFSEQATQGYTKPQNELEEKVGETAADISSYALGTPGKSILGTTTRLIGIPIAGQLAKEGVEKLGGKEGTQQAAKLGTMFLLDLWGLKHGMGQGGAKKFGETRLQEAEKAIPKGALADATVLNKQIGKLENELKAGLTGPHTSEALRAIEEMKGHIVSNKIEAARFPQLRRDINKLIENMKGFSLSGPPRAIKRASVENLNKVKSAIIQAGNRWGRSQSPEFFKNWREGNEALAVYNRSRGMSEFLSKNTKIKSPTLKVLFGMHSYHHPVAAAATGAAKLVAEKAIKIPTALIYRFTKSKVLRNLYNSILQEAGKANASAVASLTKKLEKEMEKEGIE